MQSLELGLDGLGGRRGPGDLLLQGAGAVDNPGQPVRQHDQDSADTG